MHVHYKLVAACCCLADWRLDLNSMGSSSQLSQLAAAILSRSSASSRAILMGHSLGALLAAQLLSLPDV